MSYLDLNGDVYSLNDSVNYLYNKYPDDYDSKRDIVDIATYMQVLYDEGGKRELDNKFFLPNTSIEYKKDFYKLVKQ